ncbi:MAG: Fur family transcriptional regulator [Butyricicoccus sp.]
MFRRNTIQCSLILETVNQLQHHATADEIYEIILRKYPNISRATVYRNLKRLAKTGQILKIEIPGGADCFEHICPRHYHVKCEQCGRLFDVDMEYIDDLEKKIRNTHGFEFTSHDIIFKGICPQCKK